MRAVMQVQRRVTAILQPKKSAEITCMPARRANRENASNRGAVSVSGALVKKSPTVVRIPVLRHTT